ncbi:MAG: hypothetical protein CM1200mP22_22440 [Dehalococcoidia bacterium]|nr:MAG: hypothetical protein CM1200mP22_22440 [Dehalococcoidia bacterium]
MLLESFPKPFRMMELKVEVTALLVSVTVGNQFCIDVQHLCYVVAGPGEYCRLHKVQTGLVSEEPTGINVGDFLNCLAFSEGRALIILSPPASANSWRI